jgi:hypothetical protein
MRAVLSSEHELIPGSRGSQAPLVQWVRTKGDGSMRLMPFVLGLAVLAGSS